MGERIDTFGEIITYATHLDIMAKPKKKLTAAQRAAKKQRKKDFVTVFMNGKQVRVRRPPTIEGMDADEFIRRNADPIWLHQHGYDGLI